jgi:branched-chain amino acid aminotransferase
MGDVKRQKVSSADLDWSKLTFDVTETIGRAQVTYKDGQWGPLSFVDGHSITLHVFANVLHYGQEVFEGGKVFNCKDGKVRCFNDRENYERMQSGCRRMKIPEMEYDLFKSAVDLAVEKNRAFIPPPDACAAGAALYLRPVIFGTGPQLALHPSTEYVFMLLVLPVGPYFRTGFKAIPGEVIRDYDRAAPLGVGGVKCGGNYAADMLPAYEHKKRGFPIGLYLDAKCHEFVEEFNGANLIAITKTGTYVTPESESILPSITNKCLIQLAKDKGMTVERRPMKFLEEVENWAEVGAVGTAAVVCPIKSLTMGEKTWNFAEDAKGLQELFDALTRLQRGEVEDPYGWVREVPMP